MVCSFAAVVLRVSVRIVSIFEHKRLLWDQGCSGLVSLSVWGFCWSVVARPLRGLSSLDLIGALQSVSIRSTSAAETALNAIVPLSLGSY